MSHFITRCKICDKVINQCRCISCNKKVNYEICTECFKGKTKKDKQKMTIDDWGEGVKKHLHKDFVSYLTDDLAKLKSAQINFELMYGVKLVIEVSPIKINSRFNSLDVPEINDIINNFLK